MKEARGAKETTSFDPAKLYEDLVETSQDLVWQCDVEGRYVFLNSACETIFGYSVDEMLGRRFTDFQAPDFAQRDMLLFARLLGGETSKEYETILHGKSGNEIHLVFNAKAVLDDNGRVIGTRGTAYDVTERKRIEAALRQSEQNYRVLVESMNQGMTLSSTTSKLLQVNRAAATMFGFASVDEMMQIPEARPLCAHLADGERMLSQVMQRGEINDFELEVVKRDGTPFWVSLNAVLLKGCDDSSDRLLITFTDISARKRMECELKASEEQFRTLFMSISDGFYLSEVLYDDQGNPHDYRYLEANPHFERIMGLSRDQIVGRRYRELVPVDTTQWLDNYFKVVTTGEPRTFEFHSAEYQADFETYAYQTAAGHIAVFVRDVTARKRAEEALQNVQKLSSLGVLAGGIAHDFNNLLGGIFSYIGFALEQSRDEGVIKDLTTAMSAIDRARSLTRQLLTFATGGEPDKKIDSLFPFVHQTAQFALSGSSVSCNATVPQGLWPCSYDRNQLGQVVDNIVINAREAMPDGGIIELSAANQTVEDGDHLPLRQGPYVRLSVKDQGVGMAKEMLSRVFDPFYTTKSKGHGLGLTTCHSIIRRHNGCIEVESEPGRGSTFHIYLPAVPEACVAAKTAARSQYSGAGTVIVLDDEILMQDTIARMLRSFGYVVIGAANGDETIDVLKAQLAANSSVAFLIVDLTIPGGRGGKEIISEIRRLCPEVPVFVASGYADDPIVSRPADFGFTASLPKPFTKEELVDVLDRYRPQVGPNQS